MSVPLTQGSRLSETLLLVRVGLVHLVLHLDTNNDSDDGKNHEDNAEANPPLFAGCSRRVHGLLGVSETRGR